MDEARFIAAMLRQSIELGTDVGNPALQWCPADLKVLK